MCSVISRVESCGSKNEDIPPSQLAITSQGELGQDGIPGAPSDDGFTEDVAHNTNPGFVSDKLPPKQRRDALKAALEAEKQAARDAMKEVEEAERAAAREDAGDVGGDSGAEAAEKADSRPADKGSDDPSKSRKPEKSKGEDPNG